MIREMSELDYESDEGGGGFGFGNKASDDEFESSWDGGNGSVESVAELEESIEEVGPQPCCLRECSRPPFAFQSTVD